MLIVQDYHFNRNIFRKDGAEFLNVHLERTVAVDIDDGFFRNGEFRAHGSGKPEAHGAETAGGQKLTRIFERVELCCPHLVLPHARNDHGFAVRQTADGLNDALRFEDSGFFPVGKRMLLFPHADRGFPNRTLLL